jgi:uncharacterized protein YkwD
MDLGILVLSFLLALRLHSEAGDLLTQAFGTPRTFAQPIAFLGMLLLAQVLLAAAANHFLGAIPYRWHTAAWSRLAAVVPAVGHAVLIAAALLLLVLALPLSPQLKADAERSVIGGRLLDEAVGVERALGRIFGDAIQDTLTFLTVEPEHREAIQLQVRPERTTVAPEAEQRMLALLNGEREREGLAPLSVDPEIVEVARAHSFDMWQRSYFSHVNPDGEDPFDRMREGGVGFRAAGENLALAPTVEQAHRGLMNSPGHRRNILDPAFSRIGIGVVDGGIHGMMFTQNFAD